MSKIAIIYFSQTDVTAQLAKAIAAGIESHGGVEVFSHRIAGREIVEGRFCNAELFQQLVDCEGIIFGSPTYMGGVAAQFKAFADASSDTWVEQQWSGKIAAGFTSGGAMNGDQSSTLQYIQTLAGQHGMLWLGLDKTTGTGELGLNRLGTQAGVVAQGINGEVHPSDLATAKYLGERMAQWVKRIKT